MNKRILRDGVRRSGLLKVILIALQVVLFSSCTVLRGENPAGDAGNGGGAGYSEIADKWGVLPLNARITGAGHFVDFRYRVEDPEKAKSVLDKKNKISMMDEASGQILYVPETKIGPLRGSSSKPIPGKTYAVIFSNRAGMIKKGVKVTVTIGDMIIKGIVVE